MSCCWDLNKVACRNSLILFCVFLLEYKAVNIVRFVTIYFKVQVDGSSQFI